MVERNLAYLRTDRKGNGDILVVYNTPLPAIRRLSSTSRPPSR
jgi:hypothetical protein